MANSVFSEECFEYLNDGLRDMFYGFFIWACDFRVWREDGQREPQNGHFSAWKMGRKVCSACIDKLGLVHLNRKIREVDNAAWLKSNLKIQ